MSVMEDELSDFSVEPLTRGNFVTPLRLTFNQCGRRRAWELIRVHESVGVVVFNVTRSKLLFVRQFRPAVYFNGIPGEERTRLINDPSAKLDTKKYPVAGGYTLELCAGIVDKDASLEEISAVEVEEELGYVGNQQARKGFSFLRTVQSTTLSNRIVFRYRMFSLKSKSNSTQN